MSSTISWYIDLNSTPFSDVSYSFPETGRIGGLPPFEKLKSNHVETVGRSYLSFAQRTFEIESKSLDKISIFDDAIEDEDSSNRENAGADAFVLRDDLTSKNIANFTHYEILGFDQYGVGVTDEGLKRSYRKAVLKYHPDKMGVEEGEEDEVFIAMQKAYETLIDSNKRRAYDSSLDFDDSIPGEVLPSGRDFYQVFRPVFERNERFAVLVPAASLGDENTPIEEVIKFYEYWSNFESWRDFTLEASEHNLDDAEDRYHKRWMEKENSKKIKDLKKKEYKRLNKLVDNAKSLDPRIVLARKAEMNSRKMKKDAKREGRLAHERAKIEEKEKGERERRRKVEEEQEMKKEAAKMAKIKRDEAKKVGKVLKKKLRSIFEKLSDHESTEEITSDSFTVDDLEFFIEHGNNEIMKEALEALGEDGSGGISSLFPYVEKVKAEKSFAAAEMERVKREQIAIMNAQKKRASNQKGKGAENKKPTRRPWSEDEVSALAKGAERFPSGIQGRWSKIAEFVSNSNSSQMRTKEECIAKFQTISAKPSSKAEAKGAPANGKELEDGWSDEQHRAFLAALAKYTDAMEKNERWNAIAEAVGGKSRSECVEHFKFVKAKIIERKKSATNGDKK